MDNTLDSAEYKQLEIVRQKSFEEPEALIKKQTAEILTANEQMQHEITERRRIEDMLMAQKEYIDSIVSTIPSGLVVVHSDLSVRTTNSSWREMDPNGEILPKLLEMIKPKIEKITWSPKIWVGLEQKYKERYFNIRLSKIKISAENEDILGRTETSRYTPRYESEFTLGSNYIGEQDVLLLMIIDDITDRKLAEKRQAELIEELARTNMELNDYAHIVSHDLKTPLRGIVSLANWISTDYADKLDHNGKRQIELLVGRTKRMHNLIEGILQYSRIGRVKEEKQEVDLNELVTKVIDMIAPSDNITIEIEDKLPTILCEMTRIEQVFQNLLDNAIKYMDKPKGEIKIGCADEDVHWKLSVTDNGPGIEEKYFPKIFQIFQTLRARDEYESTGVGLSVVKKIIELHGGQISVKSKVGNGCTFFFTILKREKNK